MQTINDGGTGLQRQSLAGAGASTSLFEDNTSDLNNYTVDDRSSLLALPKHHMSSQQFSMGKAPQTPLLLLKPNGAPVFNTMDQKSAKQMANAASLDQSGATMSETFDTKNQNVRAHSFVVGRKVSNQTTINLLTTESQPNPGEERPNPIKVIYQKPTVAQSKPSSQPPPNTRPTGYQDPKIKQTVKIKKPLESKIASKEPKQEVQKLNLKLLPESRPKSANPIASLKLSKPEKPHSEATSSLKNFHQRPLSAKVPKSASTISKDNNKKFSILKTEVDQFPKQETITVLYNENRFQGQYSSLTNDLVKKAQDVLLNKKLEEQKRKEELAQKKERQRQIDEQIKQANQELVQRQKDRGLTEHVNFRKLEEEAKQQAWQEENKRERELKKEIRQKRKQERDAQLGLDLVDNSALEDHRLKVKMMIDVNEENDKLKIKGGVIAPVSQGQRPKSSAPGPHPLNRNNDDLRQVNPSSRVQEPPQPVELSQAEEANKKQELKAQREAILKEQKLRRRERELEEQLKAQQAKQKKDENMRRLEEQLAIQKQENLARQEQARRLKEEQALIKKLEQQEAALRKAQNRKQRVNEASPTAKQEEQYMELHEWIDDQMTRVDQKKSAKKLEGEKEDQEIPRVTKIQVNKQMRPSSGLDLQEVVNLNYGSGDFQSNSQFKLPGNNEIDQSELQKYEPRQNRYGIFGDNGYHDYVEIHKRETPTITTKKKQKKEISISPGSKEVQLSKETVLEAFQRIQTYHQQKLDKKQTNVIYSPSSPDHFTISDIPSPHQPTLVAPGKERKILNLIHKEYAKQFEQQQQQSQPIVPGVLNIQAEHQKQQRDELQKQTHAVLVIQKWSRGLLARSRARKIRERRQRDIEAEYGYFEDQVKFNSDYNLKKFLREKEKMRERNKTAKITSSSALVQSDSIIERIGDSSSLAGSRLPKMTAGAAASQSLGRRNGKENVMLQNFFGGNSRPERDNNSIINIMLQKSMPKPAVVQSPIKLDKQSVQVTTQKQQQKTVKAVVKQDSKKKPIRKDSQDSDIVEDIISEQIEGEEPEAPVKKQHHHDSSISEDIILSGSHKGGVSSESTSKDAKPFQQLRGHKPFSSKQFSSIGESIQEDFILSGEKRTPNKKRAGGSVSYDRNSNSSIAEDSHLLVGEASRGSSSKLKNSGAIEESIHESLISDDGINSGSGSAVLPKNKQIEKERLRKVHESEKDKTNRQIEEFKHNLELDKEKREKLVNEMLGELNRYESATVSTLVLERMERVISKSLAQKDQLFLAQRLHELDLEKRHKEEIARIREEQIKLLHQLLLAGGTGISTLGENERKEIMDNFQKIMEKPIIIEQESPRKKQAQQKPLSKISESSIKESMNINDQDVDSDEIADSIEDEIEEDNDFKQSSSGSQIKESLHPADSTSIQLTNVRRGIGSEEAIRQQSKKTLQEAHGKVQKLTGGPFEKHSFNDMQEEKFKQFLTTGTGGYDSLIEQVERQVEIFKAQAHKELEMDLSRNLITPRTHHRKGEELEKWAHRKRAEIKKRIEPIHDEYRTIMNGLKKEKEYILQKIGLSPRSSNHLEITGTFKESDSLSYRDIEEDASGESDRMKNARDQINRLASKRNDLLTSYADSESQGASMSNKEELKIKKKKALAKKLLEEKERAIKDGLKQRIREIEGEQAEKMLHIAMNMDPEREIEKRMQDLKRRQITVQSVEDSSEANGVEESARSVSQSYGVTSQSGKLDVSKSMESKKKKQVHFPDKIQSPEKNQNPKNEQKSKQIKIEESIGEDILLEDSIGESLPASGPGVSQSDNKKSLISSQGSAERKSSLKNSNNKQPSVHKSEESQYSEDFDESVPDSSRKSSPVKSKLSSYQHTENDDNQDEEDVEDDYSQKFDPSQSAHTIGQSIPEDKNDNASSSQEGSGSSGSEETIKNTMSYKDSSHPEVLQLNDNFDDKEIIESSKSIQWQINLMPEQARPTPSSPSDKEDEKELESSVSSEQHKSTPPSPPQDEDDDDFDKVDMLVEEFWDILVEDIENDGELVLDKPVDEEQFKDKFPFNIRNEPEQVEEEKVYNISQASPQTIPKEPVKSQEQLAREKFEEEIKKLNDRFSSQVQYLDMLIKNIDNDDLIDQLEKPLDTDPLKRLSSIFSQTEDQQQQHQNHNETINPQTLLSLDFFQRMERQFAQEQENNENSGHETWHHKALFDAFNLALDNERPYREKGAPVPWSKQTRVVRKRIGKKELDTIVKRARGKVVEWCKTNAGTNVTPSPPPQTNNQDDQGSANPPLTPALFEQQQKDRLTALKEERLGLLMVKDLEENEHTWIDYEDDDTFIKLDLADMVLDVLSQELAEFLYLKQQQ